MKVSPVVCLLFFSWMMTGCTKSGNNIPGTTFTFNGNNKNYTWNGTLSTDSIGAAVYQVYQSGSNKGFFLYAQNDPSGSFDFMRMDITTDSVLLTKEYVYLANPFYTSLSTQFRFAATDSPVQQDYVNGLHNDSVTIRITSIQDSLVNGTFSAVLTTVGDISQKMFITEGSFQNARLIKVFL